MASDKIRVVYVLSDEQAEGFEHGFITAELIKKYISGDFTVMMCGLRFWTAAAKGNTAIFRKK